MSELPIACTLRPEELRQRRADLLPGLCARATAHETVDSGMRFTFEPTSETLAELVRVIDVERQCCRFLRFELAIERDLGPITLTVTGTAGTADFLAGLLNL